MALAIGTLALACTAAAQPSPATVPDAPAPASAAPPAATGHTLDASDLDAWLDGYLPFVLRSGDIAGAVVVVVKDGQIVTARGYGYADLATRRRVDPDRTMFRIGSLTKLLTWTAVMQQVEAGRLDLDRDVNAYLDFRIPPYDGRPVTLRQLMTHTAGFEESGKDVMTQAKTPIALDTYLKRWVPTRIYAPGTTPAYSNWGAALAGYIVQRVAGMPYADYVDQRIFAPLGMRYSSVRQPLPARFAAVMATGYPRASAPPRGFEMVGPAPAGGATASGADMARFMIAHLEGGRGLLSPRTAASMHDSPLDRVDPQSLIPPLNRAELGFLEANRNGHEVIGHLGATLNVRSLLELFINDRVGIFVAFNSGGRDGIATPASLQLLDDFADRYFPAAPIASRVDAATARQHAKLMTGMWQSSRRAESSFLALAALTGQTLVTLTPDGGLSIPSVKNIGGAPEHWDEIAPFVWQSRTDHERVATGLVDGKVARWAVDTLAPAAVFERVPAYRSSGWILPAFAASLIVLLLTALYWPATWLVRRRYRTPIALTGAPLNAYRALRIVSLSVLLVLGGWMALLAAMIANTGLISDRSDAWLYLLEIAGVIAFTGAVGIAAWNATLTWRGKRHWTSKVWSAAVLLAALTVLYTAYLAGLMNVTVNY
jgi:CubicO group peptidase (beta-lactamase class C family)